MTFNREKAGSRPMRDYDAVPPANIEDSITHTSEVTPSIGGKAVQAAIRQHEVMTDERVTDANLIPKSIIESEWGPGSTREIDQSHGPLL